MKFLLCRVCGHTMNRGQSACKRCSSKSLTHYEYYAPADSMDLWNCLKQHESALRKSHSHPMISLGLVVLIAVLAVSVHSYSSGTLKPQDLLLSQKSPGKASLARNSVNNNKAI